MNLTKDTLCFSCGFLVTFPIFLDQAELQHERKLKSAQPWKCSQASKQGVVGVTEECWLQYYKDKEKSGFEDARVIPQG